MTISVHCGPPPILGTPDRLLIPGGPERTVVIDLSDLETHSASGLPSLTRDLVTVASYVLLTDGAVDRGKRDDPLASRWRRSLRVSIPVEDPTRWTGVAELLKQFLDYATDDDWNIQFRPGTFTDQLKLGLAVPQDPSATCVLMFSGGLDSLCSAYSLRQMGERPILATHRTTAAGSAATQALISRIRANDPSWRFPNPTLHTMRAPGAGDAKEYSQRSRGFLYLSLGTAVALQHGLSRLVIAENGITSLNLAQSAQSPGAMRSRTTHPRAVAYFRELLDGLGANVAIETPFAEFTKTDVIERALELAPEQMVHAAVSCSHSIYRSRATPHCGTCSQCVDRRFSGIAAGWNDDLESPLHTVDIFTDPLEEGEAVAYVEQYVRFAVEMYDITADALAQERPEVWDALLEDDAAGQLNSIATLVRRHAGQVLRAWGIVEGRYRIPFLRGGLNPSSLLPRIGKLEHLLEPWQRLATHLVNRVDPAVRKAFGDSPPASEADVQRAFDVAQTAAREDLMREFPTVPFGLVPVGTRPDFSKGLELFVEVKFVKDAATRRRVVDEILADIPKYRSAGAKILFVVWDNCGCIPDDAAFAAEIASGADDVVVRVWRR